MEPLNILISAYACGPNMGSEPGVGWNTVQEIAKYHRVCVLTRNSNRPAIETELAVRPAPNIKFVYFDPPAWAAWLPPAQVPHYYFWQVEAYFVARRLLKSQTFDVVHHVTYVRYSTPSFLAYLPIPFIWGSVGGGEQAPQSFWQDFSLRGKTYEILRMLAHRIGELDPFTRATAKRSILVRATTNDTGQRLKYLGANNIEIFSESGLSQAELDQLAQSEHPIDSPVRFITMARLLHWKGVHLGIKAFAKFSHSCSVQAEYWILGEGPERETLERMACELGVADRVKFWGRLPRSQTLKRLSECHALVHPSLHDSGGWVCLEAMAAGRPVLCLDLGGPSVQVIDAAGIRVSAITPEQTVDDLASAMSRLAEDKNLRISLGQAGQTHVQEKFSWKTKGLQLAHLYHDYSS